MRNYYQSKIFDKIKDALIDVNEEANIKKVEN